MEKDSREITSRVGWACVCCAWNVQGPVYSPCAASQWVGVETYALRSVCQVVEGAMKVQKCALVGLWKLFARYGPSTLVLLQIIP
jgi:hypothetical protein